MRFRRGGVGELSNRKGEGRQQRHTRLSLKEKLSCSTAHRLRILSGTLAPAPPRMHATRHSAHIRSMPRCACDAMAGSGVREGVGGAPGACSTAEVPRWKKATGRRKGVKRLAAAPAPLVRRSRQASAVLAAVGWHQGCCGRRDRGFRGAVGRVGRGVGSSARDCPPRRPLQAYGAVERPTPAHFARIPLCENKSPGKPLACGCAENSAAWPHTQRAGACSALRLPLLPSPSNPSYGWPRRARFTHLVAAAATRAPARAAARGIMAAAVRARARVKVPRRPRTLTD